MMGDPEAIARIDIASREAAVLRADGVRVAQLGERLLIGRRAVRSLERVQRAKSRRDRRAAVRAQREAERGAR